MALNLQFLKQATLLWVDKDHSQLQANWETGNLGEDVESLS
jgi:hypothetical protein